MEGAVASGLSMSRTAAAIAGFFSVLALLIASLGLYALVAGARVHAGGRPPSYDGEGARLGAIGLAIGLVGPFGVTRATGGLLYGLSPGDPMTFVLVPRTLGVVVLSRHISRLVGR